MVYSLCDALHKISNDADIVSEHACVVRHQACAAPCAGVVKIPGFWASLASERPAPTNLVSFQLLHQIHGAWYSARR